MINNHLNKPQDGGDDFEEQKPKINEPKVNATSSSRGKEKIINDSEEDEPNEHELKRRKGHEAEIDEHNHIVKEVEEKARLACEAEDTLKAQKTIFPLFTLEHILKEAIENPNFYWIEPIGSFDLGKSSDPHLNFPINLKAFVFRNIDLIENDSLADKSADQALCLFYLKHMSPQYETWSSKKITTMKVHGPIETESFINACFKVAHEAVSSPHEFTFVYLLRRRLLIIWHNFILHSFVFIHLPV
ncbi:unnamed protein product [Lactuca saligna]|uniref:Uncharacterized protein n=1 Tax=Lactuca saligna TaxID=75948 RepID=A0AA36A2K0_LACSI|nr:unnamed protein product [Lactuca saligna]